VEVAVRPGEQAARWLGYIGFDQIIDQRNAEPVIREVPAAAEARILAGWSLG